MGTEPKNRIYRRVPLLSNISQFTYIQISTTTTTVATGTIMRSISLTIFFTTRAASVTTVGVIGGAGGAITWLLLVYAVGVGQFVVPLYGAERLRIGLYFCF